MNDIIFHPIGVVRSDRKFRYESPRQGVLDTSSESLIELEPNRNYEQALKELEGFDRIWVIFAFHLNPNWKPMVLPPRHSRKKVGVFASRSPHRPNPVGMSCVRLLRIEGLKLFITESDILDGSPVLDIKPYLPYCDSFPDAATGWAGVGKEVNYKIELSDEAARRIRWVKEHAGWNLERYARVQLLTDPVNTRRKRITVWKETGKVRLHALAYRTWRIVYEVDAEELKVTVQSIASGYTPEELQDTEADKYGDKNMHRRFREQFAV